MDRFEAILALISAAGAFGIAAYGVVEALGKALVWRSRNMVIGLPFVGINEVTPLARRLGPALARTYGPDYMDILIQQYREGRGKGEAPATLRQGVLLALPFMPVAESAALIDDVWGYQATATRTTGGDYGLRLASALSEEKSARAEGGEAFEPSANDAAFAGRFTAALDTRIQAAFAVAEGRYGAMLRLWAGAAAVGMAVAFNSLTGNQLLDLINVHPETPLLGAMAAALFGAVSVPLAPVANDLVSALSQAMKAWREVSVGRRGV